MKLAMFIVDAFAERPLTGNPAAVCLLETWLPATMMQAIASEMNLSETVFFAPDPGRATFGIRWFTPTREVELIGHATLAAGHLVLKRIRPRRSSVGWVGCRRQSWPPSTICACSIIPTTLQSWHRTWDFWRSWNSRRSLSRPVPSAVPISCWRGRRRRMR